MATRKPAPSLGDFLDPESMLTPGIAGSVVMFVTNALAVNFHLHRAYTGLFLSFLVGLMILVANRVLWLRLTYYVINSLVIFSVAFGTGNIAAGVNTASIRLISPAFAQPKTSSDVCKYLTNARADAQRRQEQQMVSDLDKLIAQSCSGQNKTFFGAWKFAPP